MSPLLSLNTISKTYRKRKSSEVVKAVDGVSFSMGPGEILGLLGPNGAGKTTAIKMICGLIKPDSGSITINGLDNQKQRLKSLRHISAVLEGNRNLYWRLSVKENLEYFAGNRGYSRRAVRADITKLLEQFHLETKVNELVSNLSRGMQQKLAIAVAMLAKTDLILLDEPTLGLDVETGYEVRQLLRQISDEGRTIIISTHDMPVVQDLCQRTVIINQGHVVVDDKVSNLIKLFETKAYTVTLGQALSPAQHHLLQQSFPVVTLENGEKKTLSVNLEHGEDIYKLMDILGSENTPVEAIDRTVINFEQVFRNLVQTSSANRLPTATDSNEWRVMSD
jgi:ABC-2 type transport system ATP-binding protein